MKLLFILLMLFIVGCDDGGIYDSKQDERWARTLKHAYNLGLIQGANSANSTHTFEELKLMLYKDSCEYASLVDSIFIK